MSDQIPPDLEHTLPDLAQLSQHKPPTAPSDQAPIDYQLEKSKYWSENFPDYNKDNIKTKGVQIPPYLYVHMDHPAMRMLRCATQYVEHPNIPSLQPVALPHLDGEYFTVSRFAFNIACDAVVNNLLPDETIRV
jgi:hypothetical protein